MNLGIQAVSVSYWDLYVMYINVILLPKLMFAQEAVSLNWKNMNIVWSSNTTMSFELKLKSNPSMRDE